MKVDNGRMFQSLKHLWTDELEEKLRRSIESIIDDMCDAACIPRLSCRLGSEYENWKDGRRLQILLDDRKQEKIKGKTDDK